ncbi:MAG: type II secretion system F family protein [Kiritimatiellota bacterium]|nr:type II secretion system F family protein [Kiritimatiellota bacterium]
MQTFEYTGFDGAGRAQKGLVEALDIKRAREKLAGDGLLAENIVPAGESKSARFLFQSSAFAVDERTMFYRELTALLRAGLPLVAALDVLVQSPDMGATRPILAALRDKIKEGASLAAALSHASPACRISSYEKAVIAAGERAASLGTVLERLADFMDEQARLRDRFVTALIYPAIIFFVAIAIAIGLLGFGIPRIGNLLMEESHIALPLLTRGMIRFGSLFMHAGLPALALALVGAVFWWRTLASDPEKARNFNRRLFGVPVIGPGYAILVSLRFARTLALLINGGVALIDGLPLAGEATGSRWVATQVAAEADAVRHGRSLADMLRRIPPFGSLFGWVQVGEASGELARMLDSAADRLQQQWNRFLTRRMNMLEPALILIIGVFVLLVVLAVLLPILTLNQHLK